MKLADVLLHPDEFNGTALATPWVWLLRDEFEVVQVTVFGNLVLIDKLQRIWLLDSWSGQLHGVSESYDEYKLQVAINSDFFRSWFLTEFIETLRATGLNRPSGFVFAPLVSPSLGGSLSKENFSLAPLNAHNASAASEAALFKKLGQ